MTYCMTISGNLIGLAPLEQCKATTLAGAKSEATRRFGGGFIGTKMHVLEVGRVDQFGTPEYVTVATRTIGGRGWELTNF